MRCFLSTMGWILTWCLCCALVESTFLKDLELAWIMVLGLISFYCAEFVKKLIEGEG